MIERDDRHGIRFLRLAHGKVSAIDIELGEAFAREMESAAPAPVSAVVITGSGATFSAGVITDGGSCRSSTRCSAPH